MTNWHDFVDREGTTPSWPYPVDYEKENEIEIDVLVIGGGIAGCWAAISAARKGVRVALVEKGCRGRGSAGSSNCSAPPSASKRCACRIRDSSRCGSGRGTSPPAP